MPEKSRKRRGRGEGGITFDEARGLWVATLSLGHDGQGRRRRRRVYGKTKGEALAKLREAQSRSPLVDAAGLTVGAYLTHWLENTARPRVAPKTYHRYRQVVDGKLIPHLGGIKLAKLTALNVQALYPALGRAGASQAAQRKAGTVLSVALRDACRVGLIPSNPVPAVQKPRVETAEIHPLTREQALAFIKAAREDRLAGLFILAVDTGARLGELLALTWGDVDLTAGSVRFVRTLEEIGDSRRVKDSKTKASRRAVQLSSLGLQALKDHKAAMEAEGNYRPAGLVFPDQAGGYLRGSNVRRRNFLPIFARAGIPPVRFHDLRHTMASLLLAEGVPVKTVQERLGHSQPGITLAIYAHSLPGAQQQAAAQLGRLLGGEQPGLAPNRPQEGAAAAPDGNGKGQASP